MDPIVNTRAARYGSYVIAFLITAFIFGTAFAASSYFNQKRIAEVRAAQEDISANILSLETQFDLLSKRSCTNISENTILPKVLASLGQQLSYLEQNAKSSSEEVSRLKRMYSLFEIKDYLLMKEIARRCGLNPVFILYFYSNKGDCTECENQGYVLTALAQEYPQLRIYSFDYNLDDGALQTLIDTERVGPTLPALVIEGKLYTGLYDLDGLRKILPEFVTTRKATSTKTQ